MINMRVRYKKRVYFARIEFKVRKIHIRVLVASLKKSAVNKNFCFRGLKQITGAGYLPRAAVKRQFHIPPVYSKNCEERSFPLAKTAEKKYY